MKIIVPMAGMGKRMRPHTLTTPKPLISVAGKPIVQRLVEDIAALCKEPIEEIAFIIKDSFGDAVEEKLKTVAAGLGAKGSICYQTEALGTAHAIMCAKHCLEGPVVIAFADTLFKADFELSTERDGIIWVKRVEDPRQFGVVKAGEDGVITEFHEKPEEFISDMAIIGIYFVNDGAKLKAEIQHLLDNDIKEKGEYQLTNALENLKAKGAQFETGTVIEWLDCGNKNATVNSNKRVLAFDPSSNGVAKDATVENSTIIEPCLILAGASIKNSVVGPHVTVGAKTIVEGSVISNALIGEESSVSNACITNSMIGNHSDVNGKVLDLSVGDYNNCTL